MATDRVTRRQFLTRAVALAGGLAGVAILAGCGATPTPTAKPKAEPTKPAAATTGAQPAATTAPVTKVPAKAEKIKLRVQTIVGVRGMKAIEFGKRYMQANPNITVVNEELADRELKTELLFGTGELQDICYAMIWFVAVGAHKGWYRELDDLLKADPNIVPDYKDFFPILVENIKVQGKTYSIIDWAIPGSTTFVYNRHIFKDAGVSGPERKMGAIDVWQLKEMLLKLVNKEKGIFGFTGDYARTFGQEQWARSWGKPMYGPKGDTSSWFISPDGKKFSYASNEAAKAWYKDWFRPLLDARAIPKTADQVEGGLFYAGRQAVYQWQVMEPRRTWLRVKDKWDYNIAEDWFHMPKGPEGRIGTASQTQTWHVGGLTKYPEEALRLIGFMTSREAGMYEIFEAESGYTARASVYTDPKVVAYSPNYKTTHELLISGNVDPILMPWNLRWIEANTAFANVWTPLAEGQKTWEEQAPVIQNDVDKVFAQPLIPK